MASTTMGKVSTDESVQNFSHYLSLLSTCSTDVFWRPNSHSTKKIAVSTAEPFVLTISTNLSHSVPRLMIEHCGWKLLTYVFREVDVSVGRNEER